MNILVTGATGLLGAHTLWRLTADPDGKNRQVMALRRPTSDLSGVQEVFGFYSDQWDQPFASIRWREGDLMDPLSLRTALKDVDVVCHCAAIVSFDPRDRNRLIENNIQGTKNLLEALEATNPAIRLIHISSTSALGDGPGHDPDFLINENTPRDPSRRHSGYSVSKYESEQLVLAARQKGLQAIIFNPGIILGPGFWTKGSSKLFTKMQEGLRFYTGGGTGYVDVRDTVDLMVKVVEEWGKGEKGKRGKGEITTNPHSSYCLVGANLYYRDFFNQVADALGVKRPSVRAGRFLSGLAWRADTLKARLSGGYPLITRETAESANRISFYSSEQIQHDLDFTFRPVEDTIQWVCRCLKDG